jgi:hypothetical protein
MAARGADDPAGDLAAIGDEERGSAITSGTRRSAALGIGALSGANARPSTSRVCAGSMMPSSHSRAVACRGCPRPRISVADRRLEGLGLSRVHLSASRWTVASTLAACSPPITEMRLLGQVNRKRG